MAISAKWRMRLVLSLCLAAACPIGAASTEADIKAAFVYNFAKFVEWPSSTFAAGNTPLELCTLDGNALEGRLTQLNGREAQGRTIHVRNLGRVEDWPGCQIIFLGTSDLAHQPQLLRSLSKAPVLTVSDIPGFAQKGGMIGLFVEANRIQFSVNLNAAQQGGLRLSARMLQLARIVAQEGR